MRVTSIVARKSVVPKMIDVVVKYRHNLKSGGAIFKLHSSEVQEEGVARMLELYIERGEYKGTKLCCAQQVVNHLKIKAEAVYG